MKLTILIVNWRSKDYLRKCLQTVRATCADLAPQIVIVDGGSFDGCGEMLETEFPETEFVQSPDNIGFGRCNNLGFERARGELLLLLNPDTELRPESVQRLVNVLESRPDAGIVAPRLLNTDGSLQVHCVRALPTPLNRALDSDLLRRWMPNSRLWGVGEAFRASAPVVVEAVSGACMLLRSEVFRRAGGFSPQFFMYGEDMDLCAKMHRQGLRNIHVPGVEVLHHGGGSTQTQASQFSTDKMRMAWDLYFKMNHGAGAVARYRLLQAASAMVRFTCLCPVAVFAGHTRRVAARCSLQKWWYVLMWSLRRSPQ